MTVDGNKSKKQKVFFQSAVKDFANELPEFKNHKSKSLLKKKAKMLINQQYREALKGNIKAPERHLKNLRIKNIKQMSKSESRFKIIDQGLKKDGIDPINIEKVNKNSRLFGNIGSKYKNSVSNVKFRNLSRGLGGKKKGFGLGGMMRKTMTVY